MTVENQFWESWLLPVAVPVTETNPSLLPVDAKLQKATYTNTSTEFIECCELNVESLIYIPPQMTT
jgi:hypothetical protein